MGHGQVGRPEGPPSRARLTPAPRAPTIVPMAQTYTFPIPADGSYAVEGDAVKITVEKKPMIVPWGMIESALKDLFKG